MTSADMHDEDPIEDFSATTEKVRHKPTHTTDTHVHYRIRKSDFTPSKYIDHITHNNLLCVIWSMYLEGVKINYFE